MSQTDCGSSRIYRDPWYAKNRVKALDQYREYRRQRTTYVRPEELEACREDPTLAWTIRGPHWIICLECGALKEQLGHHLRVEHRMTALEYKQKPASEVAIPRLSKGTSLSSSDVQRKHSRSTKTFQRRHGAPDAFVETSTNPPIEKMFDGRRRSVRSLQARIETNKKLTGKPKPGLWGTFRGIKLPKSTSDQQIAAMRLEGSIASAIAEQVGLTRRVILARLRKMNFPSGPACVFHHGEPLLGEHILTACQDFNKTLEEMARYMGVKIRTLRYHTANASLEKPLPADIGRKLNEVHKKLREEFRHQPADREKGGAPHLLLPSERANLQREYRSVLSDFQKIMTWLSRRTQQDSKASVDELRNWLYSETRKGQLSKIAFWPDLLYEIRSLAGRETQFLRGSIKPSHLTRQLLSQVYGVSVETIRRLALSA